MKFDGVDSCRVLCSLVFLFCMCVWFLCRVVSIFCVYGRYSVFLLVRCRLCVVCMNRCRFSLCFSCVIVVVICFGSRLVLWVVCEKLFSVVVWMNSCRLLKWIIFIVRVKVLFDFVFF